VIATARQLKGPDADLADVLKKIIADEHVPLLAACRYKPSGLDKRAQWERTWDLQREEDATGQRQDIPVPPKYVGANFQKQSYWRPAAGRRRCSPKSGPPAGPVNVDPSAIFVDERLGLED